MYIFVRHGDKEYTNKVGRNKDGVYAMDPPVLPSSTERKCDVFCSRLAKLFGVTSKSDVEIHTSPLLRCRETANYISSMLEYDTDSIKVDSRVSSYFGHQSDLNLHLDEQKSLFFHPSTCLYHVPIENNIDDFNSRVLEYKASLPKLPKGKVVIVVTHDFFMKIFFDTTNSGILYTPLYYSVYKNVKPKYNTRRHHNSKRVDSFETDNQGECAIGSLCLEDKETPVETQQDEV